MANQRRGRRRGGERASEVVGYVRCSTERQAESGAGLDAQRAAISAECERRGLVLASVYEDAGLSGRSLDRPALAEALDALDAGRASALVVAKLDRLSRSLLDFATVMARAERNGWKLIALDLGIDTTTPSGEFTATVVAGAARYEGRLISARTRDALAARKAAGVRLGRPRQLARDVAERIRNERQGGATLQAIADGLNGEGISTPSGRRWSPALIRKVAIQEPAA